MQQNTVLRDYGGRRQRKERKSTMTTTNSNTSRVIEINTMDKPTDEDIERTEQDYDDEEVE